MLTLLSRDPERDVAIGKSSVFNISWDPGGVFLPDLSDHFMRVLLCGRVHFDLVADGCVGTLDCKVRFRSLLFAIFLGTHCRPSGYGGQARFSVGPG